MYNYVHRSRCLNELIITHFSNYFLVDVMPRLKCNLIRKNVQEAKVVNSVSVSGIIYVSTSIDRCVILTHHGYACDIWHTL